MASDIFDPLESAELKFVQVTTRGSVTRWISFISDTLIIGNHVVGNEQLSSTMSISITTHHPSQELQLGLGVSHRT